MLTDLLLSRLDEVAVLGSALERLRHGRSVALCGAVGPVRGLISGWLGRKLRGPLLIVTSYHDQAERLAEDVALCGAPDDRVYVLPALERDSVLRSAVDYGALGDRMAALRAMAMGEPAIVVGTLEGVLQRVGPPEETLGARIAIRRGETAALDMLLHRLSAIGYLRVTTATQPGHYASRGGILDIFPIGAQQPVRIEFFGNEIERMRLFDPGTQRSTADVDQAEVLPVRGFVLTRQRVARAVPIVRELLARRCEELVQQGQSAAAEELDDRIGMDLARLREREYFETIEDYIPYIVPEDVCALDYLAFGRRGTGETPVVVLDDPLALEMHWAKLLEERADARERRKERGDLLEGASWSGVSAHRLEGLDHEAAVLELYAVERNQGRYSPDPPLVIRSALTDTVPATPAPLKEELDRWLGHGALCVVVTDKPHRTREVLTEQEIPLAESPTERGVLVVEGRMRQGFKLDEARLFVLTDAELFGRSQPAAPRKRVAGGVAVSTLLDLQEGDYVVHVVHGIGIYRGLVRRMVDGAEKDYLAIQYAGTDRLYVPADQIDRVQRYVGVEGARPALNRLGGSDWQRTQRRVREQTRKLAADLIKLYAARETAQRPPYGEDSPWQIEMEEAFPYEPTPSQLRAIQEIKGDLAGDKPADRLLCGDVGFGKTEVAIRAAFKVVEAGKQVAVLCPTTVLAAQHYTTFSERLSAYPIRVELLSRFRSREDQKRTLANLRTGATDIVIGTHRLLSKDVEFARLGLLVIDEEQRFGVAQKERLKQLRTNVDVLTLTATPIPRTLSMALSGLREMSVIEDPPEGRLPIETYVHEYNEELVRDAILRELNRGGQVYFVHNRVATIDAVAARLRRLVPDARIVVAHGQMSEDQLERIMHGFYLREYDVLVCTTIIENGLDIPSVNTIIVDGAERLGLAQMYQLRGRVGRSNRQAYAYLLVRERRVLSEEAEKRLLALREYTALGSGYQIALRDLEIRGAGNLLGAEQSGAMSAVGFDMYCRLLAQAVAEARGQDPQEEAPLPEVDLPVTAHIPDTYIPNEAERIFFYRKLSGSRTEEDLRDLLDELTDRFGTPPRAVWNAMEILRLRIAARQAGLAGLRYENRSITVRIGPQARFSVQSLEQLTRTLRGCRFTADAVIAPIAGTDLLREAERIVKAMAEALQKKERRAAV